MSRNVEDSEAAPGAGVLPEKLGGPVRQHLMKNVDISEMCILC